MKAALTDESDDELPSIFKPNLTFSVEEDADISENITDNEEEFCKTLELLWLQRDISSLISIQNESRDIFSRSVIVSSIIDLLNGKHTAIVKKCKIWMGSILLINMGERKDYLNQVRDSTLNFIKSPNENFQSLLIRSMMCLVLGTTLYELFCQMNYTGPELSQYQIDEMGLFDESEEKKALEYLECDGSYPFPICQVNKALLISRIVLSTLAHPNLSLWASGVSLSYHGDIVRQPANSKVESYVEEILSTLFTRSLRNARSCVIHSRSLQIQGYENIPTLWRESQDCYDLAEKELIDHNGNLYRVLCGKMVLTQLQTELLLERGLCEHHFLYKHKGKAYYARAKAQSGLAVYMSGAKGKRTKYQQQDHAQLFIYAKSNLSHTSQTSMENEESRYSFTIKQSTIEGLSAAGDEDNTSNSSWQHGEFEVGRRLVQDVKVSSSLSRCDGVLLKENEEAAVREVLLDSIDGGPQENILLEGGPVFSEAAARDRGGELHPVDQAVLLSLCLDVKNNNPVDGLTNEEMYPYIERVLQSANNWMIHSSALYQRSCLEFERRKTTDRALLQMQALLDQHTTKLTVTQSTFKSIEESAPSHERLRYLHCIVYPAQFELKRDLAERYLQYQVFVSALNYFKELEMWDEVVACYQLMDKPQRAEWVVRERLKLGKTPYMLTALADVTGKEEFYEEAWELSNRRFARAKRTLGRLCFHRKQYNECFRHMTDALAVHPLLPQAWYLKGLACIHLEEWNEGLQCFTRCVQQDMEIGEAWGNMGAIYMRMGKFENAYVALVEARKQKRESFQVLENMMGCALALKRWQDVVDIMNSLLDQNVMMKSKNPVHIRELRTLVYESVNAAKVNVETTRGTETPEKNISNDGMPTSDRKTMSSMPYLTKSVEKLLRRMVDVIDTKTSLDVWAVMGDFYEALDSFPFERECRMKQFRALSNQATTFHNVASIEELISCAHDLTNSYRRQDVTKTEVYACRSILITMLRSIDQHIQDHNALSNTKLNVSGGKSVLSVLMTASEKMTALIEEMNRLFDQY